MICYNCYYLCESLSETSNITDDSVEHNHWVHFLATYLDYVHAMFQTLSNNCVNRSSVKAVTQMVALNNTLHVLDLSGT